MDFVSDAYAAYAWTDAFGVHGGDDTGGALDFISDEIPSGRKLTAATASENMLVGCFDGEYGEAYMLAGFTDPLYGKETDVMLAFDGVRSVAIYTATKDGCRVEATNIKNGKVNVTLPCGGGAFIVPLKGE